MGNPLWGEPESTANCSSLVSKSAKPRSGDTCRGAPKTPPRPGAPFCRTTCPTLSRSAVDMFVVATATFRLFYALIVLGHDRRRIIHFDVTQNPTQAWLSRQ